MLSKPVLGGAVVVVAAVAVAAAVALGGGDDPVPTAAGTPSAVAPATTPARATTPAGRAPSTRDPVAPAGESDRSLCQVQGPAIAVLTAGARGDGRFEILRDAIPELDRRVSSVEAVAGTRAAVRTVVVTLRGVHTDWVTALQAYDEGDKATGTTALGAADAGLATAATEARTALPPGTDCG
jgi:hypothetical protein